MIKKYGDIISGIAILIFSIIVYIITFSFNAITVSKTGPDFMPKLVAVGLAVLSIIVVVKGVKKAKAQVQVTDIKGNGVSDTYGILASFILISVYIALLQNIGFLIMTAVYLFGQMIVLTKKSQRKLGLFSILSVLISISIYALFVYVFKLVLPTGILG